MQIYETRHLSLSAITTYSTLQELSFEEMQFFLLSADNKRVYAWLYAHFLVTLQQSCWLLALSF